MTAENSDGTVVYGRPFQKGVSGNPGGRSASVKLLRERARGHTDEAIATLVEALKDENVHARITAAKEILAIGWGKPSQSILVEQMDNADQPKTIEHEEVRASLDFAAFAKALKIAGSE